MPAKANWLRKIRRLQSLSTETTAAEIAIVLGISNRRAQQLTERVPARVLGNVRVMQRDAVVRALRGISEVPANDFELNRLQSLRAKLDQWNQEISAPNRLMVSAPTSVVNATIDGLPEGVALSPGRVVLDVNDGQDALQKLLTLCFAIRNSYESFDLAVTRQR